MNSTLTVVEFCYRAIKVTQGSRTLALLPEDQNSVPSTHTGSLTNIYNSRCKGCGTFFGLLQTSAYTRIHIHAAIDTHRDRQTDHTHKKKQYRQEAIEESP